jgi:hypothetical protein
MSKYRARLPQLNGGLCLTDGGIEPSLIYQDGLDLPHFAAFHLLRDAAGRAALRRYYTRYAEIARAAGVGFVLVCPSWRASADWGAKLGYSAAAMDESNRAALAMIQELEEELESARSPMLVSGCVGPRG